MSDVEAILQRSRAPGRFVERRRFTLSRDKAIEKLREFALREPAQYVLELVQAAVFADARWIAVDVTPRRLLFAWVGGRPLPADGLENIFDSLFASQVARETRPMVQLAIALNAILQRKPSLLRIESGDGTPNGTVRLDMDKNGQAILGTPEEWLEGTYLLAEFGSSWLPRFPPSEQPREASLIEETCRYTPVPILLNGTAPFGYRATREFVLPRLGPQITFDDGVRRGVLASPGKYVENKQIDIVVGGVRITSVPSDELTGGPPLIGVICDDTLRKTADQSDIVRDNRWLAMRHAIREPLSRAIQNKTPGYLHPELAPVIEETPERKPAAQTPRLKPEPLPEFIGVVGPGPEVHLEGLRRLDPREPLFFVPPDFSAGMAASLDPASFPYRVLVLRDQQALTFREELPGRSLSRLIGPADADFVRTAIERRARTVQRSLQTTIETPEGESLTGRLVLQHHLGGPRPGWGDPEEGEVPVLIAHDGKAIVTGRLPIDDLGISVRFELIDRWTPVEGSRLQRPLTAAVLEHGWRLALALHDTEEANAAATFTGRLLGAVALPHFSGSDGATSLEVTLPGSWPNEAKALLDIDLTGASPGGLTLRELTALQGGDAVRTLSAVAHLDALEQKLGMGHLGTSVLDRSIVLGAGWTGRQWRVLHEWFPHENPLADLDIIAAILVLPTVRSHVELPAHWSIQSVVGPGLVQLEGASAQDHETPWFEGTTALVKAMKLHARHGEGRGAISTRRATERIRLARLQISATPRDTALGLGGSTPAMTPSSLAEVRVLPRHGMPLLERNTVAFTLDELRCIESRVGERLSLRFDDATGVWESLLAPDEGAWLLREEAHSAGLRATLGLRFPHDGTTGVLLSGTGGYVPLPQIDSRQPCHGLAVLVGGSLEPTKAQTGALLLARNRLYRRLEVGIHERRWTGAELEAARQYHDSTTEKEQTGVDLPLMGYLERKLAVAAEGERVRFESIANGPKDDPVSLAWGVGTGPVLRLNNSNPLVRKAFAGLDSARGLVLVETLRLIALDQQQPLFAAGLVRLATDEV